MRAWSRGSVCAGVLALLTLLYVLAVGAFAVFGPARANGDGVFKGLKAFLGMASGGLGILAVLLIAFDLMCIATRRVEEGPLSPPATSSVAATDATAAP